MKSQPRVGPNILLRRQREQRHWTQTELARMLNTTYLSVCRWENGTTTPSLYYRKRLCEVFDLPPEELGLAPSSSPKEDPPSAATTAAVPVLWNVPYRRNPFFTGREHILMGLHPLLRAGKKAAFVQTQAISGLGGIGKTQTAIEFAYRYREHYSAVLWARGETRSTLMSDLTAIAYLLDLPEKNEQQQERIVQATRRWLQTSKNWLLILDNVEDLSLVEEVLPAEYSGHVLLTTRAQSTGTFAQRVDLEQMEPEEGALFLLRRAKLIAPDAPLEALDAAVEAQKISQVLDGLPLALDQAGAYIEETGCGLADYLERYQQRRAALLSRRGLLGTDHPESVDTTLSLAFERVKRANPAAAELLRFCAFLDPDAIPEEILTEGASELGPILGPVAADQVALDAALADLRHYSLLRRNPDSRTLTLHRLVQAVLKEHMNEQEQQQLVERCVKIVIRAFPSEIFAVWQRGQCVLAQAQTCVELIKQYNLCLQEAAQLLDKTGWYLLERALYGQAESLLQQALALKEQIAGPMHAETASTLNNLAILHFYQGRYEQAEPLFQRALAIREQALGAEHPMTANTFDSLGVLYTNQGRYAQAELLLLKALSVEEKLLGAEHPDTTATLNNLALLYYEKGKYQEAEVLYQRVLAIQEKTLGPEHLFIAITLDNLAKLYYAQKRYEQAEPLYRRALSMEKNVVGFNHPSTSITLANLGQLSHAQGHLIQAESFYLHALQIKEQILGSEHPDTAYTLAHLAKLYSDQGKDQQAEALYQKALAIQEKAPGTAHPHTALTLDNLAQLWEKQGRYDQAEPFFKRALTIREQHLGAEHPDTLATRTRYTALVEKMG